MVTTRKTAPRPQLVGELDEILTEWRTALRASGKSPATIEVYTYSVTALARFLRQSGRPTDVALVGREAVEAFLASLVDTGRKEASVSVRYRSLKSFFKWAAEEASIGIESPMARMKPPIVPEPVTRVLSEEEIAHLVKTTEADKTFEGLRDAAIIRLFIDTGIRRAELAGMTVADLAAACTVGYFDVLGKGRRTRTVGIASRTQQAMQRYKRVRAQRTKAHLDAAWISGKGALTPSAVYQAVESRGKAAGLDIKPHALRHSWAARNKFEGMSDSNLMALGGWRSPQIMMRYGRIAETKNALAAAQRLALGDRF